MILDTRFRFTIIDYTTNPLGDSMVIDEPIGWDGVQFELARLDTHGFVSRLNVDGITFEFHSTAKDILIAAYDSYGVEAQVELKIEYKGNPSDSYSQIYKGLFKFNTYEKICGFECKVTCGVSQDGYYYLFANRKNQSVTLDNATGLASFDGTILTPYTELHKFYSIPAKALKFSNKSSSNSVSGSFPQGTFISNSWNGFAYGIESIIFCLPQETVLSNEIEEQQYFEQLVNGDASATPNTGTIKYWYEQGGLLPNFTNKELIGISCDNTTIDLNIGINATIVLNSIGASLDYSYCSFDVAYIFPESGTIVQLFNGTHHTTGGFNHTHTVNISEVVSLTGITLPKGAYLFYGISFIGVLQTAQYQDFTVYYNISNFDYELINYSNCDPTPAKVSMINEVFARQVESYTNAQMTVKSDYFGRTDSEPYTSSSDGCGSLECLSSGLQMRGALDANNTLYSLKQSFDSTFNSMSKIHNIGYGVEPDSIRGGDYKWIRIENYEYFYQSDVLLELDYPNEISNKVVSSDIYSKVNIGYNNWATEEDGGIQDIFSTREYGLNLKRANNTLDILSDFIASDFAIEVTRRLYGLSKKDWRYDDKTFIMCMFRDGGFKYIEQGSDIPIISSSFVYSPDTLKNVRITPIRNFLRFVPVLLRYLKPSLTWEFKFNNGTANYIAQLQNDNVDCFLHDYSVLLAENETVNQTIYSNQDNYLPILSNDLVTFDYPLNCSQWNDITANPYGRIGYKCPQDNDYTYGWIKSLQYNPTKGLATINLIKEYTS